MSFFFNACEKAFFFLFNSEAYLMKSFGKCYSDKEKTEKSLVASNEEYFMFCPKDTQKIQVKQDRKRQIIRPSCIHIY